MRRAPSFTDITRSETLSVWLRLSPFFLLALLALVQVLTPEWVQLGFVLAAVPPLAALVNGPRATVVVVVVVLALFLILDRYQVHHHTAADVDGDNIPTVLAIGVGSVAIAWIRERSRAKFQHMSSVAEAAQRAVLPDLPPTVGTLACSAYYRAAVDDSLVGGDFFEVVDNGFSVRAVVGDVKGHGLEAVGGVAALLGSFREGSLDDANPLDTGWRMERRMEILNSADEDPWSLDFATAVIMDFATDGRSVRVVCYGHQPPILFRGRTARPMECRQLPAMGLSTGPHPFLQLPLEVLEPGDIVLAFTDGVTEARDEKREFYPLTERLESRLEGHGPFRTPEDVVSFVQGDLLRGRFVPRDDIAILALGVPSLDW